MNEDYNKTTKSLENFKLTFAELQKLLEVDLVDETALRDLIIRIKYQKQIFNLSKKSKKKKDIKEQLANEHNLSIKAIEGILSRIPRRKKSLEINERDIEELFE